MDFLADPDTTGPGDAGPQHIAAGKVRGDDTIRLYIPGPYNTLHEYTYSNGLWRDTIIEQGLCGIHLVIGNGRNDGKERLYSAAHNKVFEHNYSLGIEESNPLPFDKGELLQVFPNPSVKGFYIQYAVPSKSSIVLEVFDSSGRKVRTLLNDCKDEGIYKIYWNAKTNSKESLGAGVYFCRMRVKEQTLIKKILLLR